VSASIAAAEVYLTRNKAAEVIELLRPMGESQPGHLTVQELLGRAYLAIGDFDKAQPICWKLYQAQPATLDLLMQLVEGRVQKGQAEAALDLLGQLKPSFVQQGKKNEFLKLAENIYDADQSSLPMLEMLAGLYNEFNKEEGLRRSLTRLFNLYLAADQYQKSGDTLERIIDVDPYGEGHYDRLLNLEGHIDKIWYDNIAARVEPPTGGRAAGAPAAAGTAAGQGEALDDLIIEGEMYYQYQLTAKLRATLERINQLYPGAEEKNQRLRELYSSGGFRPAPTAASPVGTAMAPSPEAGEPARPVVQPQSLEELQKISEITANIYRESTPQGAMQVAVSEVGRALAASRAWGAIGSPERAPTLSVEYCSPGATGSDASAVLRLFTTLMEQAPANPDGWLFENPAQFPVLAPIQLDIKKLGIRSLLAAPLMDRDQPAGLLLIEQCDRSRSWTPGEMVMVRAIGTQVVIAVNNTKLRRRVRSLAGTDEETGLMPRSSYLDCLLAEAARGKEQSQPVSVCLVEPENPTALVKALGDAGMQRYFQQVAKALQSNLRQNDIPIRYSPCAIAIVFPDTPLPQGGLAVEKLRRAVAQVKPDGQPPPVFCAAVCDLPLGPNFDAVDGVTEVINRLEAAIEQSRKEGGKRVFVSAFPS
jgi:GGDEF domain-containing protein/tetratricopeptide (TPR) repeat protein